MSNSPAILARLTRRCSRGLHHHVPLMGGRAAGAAIYPPDLCLPILRLSRSAPARRGPSARRGPDDRGSSNE
eukprot:14735635-Heterocapsa_arctica.AAC.1